MSQGWTGGQISVVRATVGGAAATWLLVALVDVLLHGTPDAVWIVPGLGARLDEALPTVLAVVLSGVGLGLAAAVAAGIARRPCAVLLAAVWLVLHGAGVTGPTSSWPTIEAVFLLLALLPRAPFGSLAARGRVDPAGDWRLPGWWSGLAWSLLVVTYAGVALAGLFGAQGGGPDAVSTVLPVLLAGIFASRTQPFAWLALIVFDVGWWWWTGVDPSHGALWLHAVTFVPMWLAAPTGATTHVFYDGGCGLCHANVRLLLAEDPVGDRFRFAPLGGPTFEATIDVAERRGLPDSLVVHTAGGRTLVRSRGIVYLLGRLGGLWSVLGGAVRLVPPPLRDRCYDAIARSRGRLFQKPVDACPILPEHLRARFDP